MKELNVYDLLVLEVLQTEHLSYRELFARVNELIATREMPSDYVTPASNKSAVENSLRRLHASGLIDAPSNSAAIQRPAVLELLNRVGADWRQWPFYIPILDRGLDYQNMKER